MNCLNLCDLIEVKDFQNKTLEELISVSDIADLERLYIGSYFCSQYFLMMDFIDELSLFLKKTPFKLTLVIPVFTEKDLISAKEKIDFILKELPVDEVTVNDVGMLSALSLDYSIRLNLGRLFFKDERDIRAQYLYQKTTHPAEFGRIDDYFKQYPVYCAELDPISKVIDLQNDTDIRVALHEPFCYLTTGNICKYASVDIKTDHKFRPNAPCKKECQKIHEIYTPDSSDYKLYRIGRTIYFPTTKPQIVNGHIDRTVFFPFFELMKIRKEGVNV